MTKVIEKVKRITEQAKVYIFLIGYLVIPMTDSIDLTEQQRKVFDTVKIVTGFTKDSQVIGILIGFYIANWNDPIAIERTNKMLGTGGLHF
jgi:hypothetical protein